MLPAAGYAETDGTTTNLEGRVSRLSPKVTPPGTARADWIIAAELAFRLGDDLGIESAEAAFDEFTTVSAAHRGLTIEAVGIDGAVVPLGSTITPKEGAPPDADVDPEAAEAAVAADAADSDEEATEAEAEATEAQADAEEGEGDEQADETESADAEPAPVVSGPEVGAGIVFTAPSVDVPAPAGYDEDAGDAGGDGEEVAPTDAPVGLRRGVRAKRGERGGLLVHSCP